MQIIVEVTSELRTYSGRNPHWDVIEVRARKLFDWREIKASGRLLEDKYIDDKKIRVMEFIVEVEDYSDKDIAEYKIVLDELKEEKIEEWI